MERWGLARGGGGVGTVQSPLDCLAGIQAATRGECLCVVFLPVVSGNRFTILCHVCGHVPPPPPPGGQVVLNVFFLSPKWMNMALFVSEGPHCVSCPAARVI